METAVTLLFCVLLVLSAVQFADVISVMLIEDSENDECETECN